MKYRAHRIKFQFLLIILASLLLLSLGSCGGQLAGSVGNNCYECQGVDYACTCPQGYGGYYNPDALDIYRPGRFDDINSPVW